MFDTKTEQFQEWKLTARWASPYDVILENENAWTGSMITDQVTRLDTKTGEYCFDYLLPRSYKHPPRFCRQYDNAG